MRSGQGFTLVETMVAIAIMGIVITIAYGQYADYIERTKVAIAKADIVTMQTEMVRYQSNHEGRLPASLAEIGRDTYEDPWGLAYYYVDLSTVNKGKARKDHRLNPINSDYDLFSAGKNGVYKSQVSQKDSVDDVIRGRDGSFIGLAKDF